MTRCRSGEARNNGAYSVNVEGWSYSQTKEVILPPLCSPVDGLVIISDNRDTARIGSKLEQELQLSRGRVLGFINEHVLWLVLFEYIRVPALRDGLYYIMLYTC